MAHRLRSTYRHMHHIPLVAEALPPTYGVRKNIKPLSIESEPSGTVLGLQCISALCIRKQKTFSKSRKILGPFRSQPPQITQSLWKWQAYLPVSSKSEQGGSPQLEAGILSNPYIPIVKISKNWSSEMSGISDHIQSAWYGDVWTYSTCLVHVVLVNKQITYIWHLFTSLFMQNVVVLNGGRFYQWYPYALW